MKRILLPISFSQESANSIQKATKLFDKAKLTLLHCYSVRTYNREYDFGDQDYEDGLTGMLDDFYKEHRSVKEAKVNLIIRPGNVSEIIANISHLYDLIVISRKQLKEKDDSWYSDKVFYIASKGHCPVLLLPVLREKFDFKDCNNIWHINRRDIESDLLIKYLPKLGINPEKVEKKSIEQTTFKSSFWKALVSYSKTHDESLLKVMKESTKIEKVDLIILVSHGKDTFQKFMKSEVIQLINQFNIPLLIYQAELKA